MATATLSTLNLGLNVHFLTTFFKELSRIFFYFYLFLVKFFQYLFHITQGILSSTFPAKCLCSTKLQNITFSLYFGCVVSSLCYILCCDFHRLDVGWLFPGLNCPSGNIWALETLLSQPGIHFGSPISYVIVLIILQLYTQYYQYNSPFFMF